MAARQMMWDVRAMAGRYRMMRARAMAGQCRVMREARAMARQMMWDVRAMAGHHDVGGEGDGGATSCERQGQCGAAGSLQAVEARCVVSDG